MQQPVGNQDYGSFCYAGAADLMSPLRERPVMNAGE